jgi:hypothetical protein
MHIEGGYTILKDWSNRSRASSRTLSPSGPETPVTNSETDLMEQLTSLFSRLRVQSIIFGKQLQTSPVDALEDQIPSPILFRTLNEARDENFRIINGSVGLISTSAAARYDNTVTAEQRKEQSRLKTRLQQWRKSLDDFLKQQTLESMELKSTKMLKAQNLITYVWLSVCLSSEETQYDQFTKEFEEAVRLSDEITDMPVEYLCNSVGRFQFDIGLLPVLHFVGSKCRWPHIRRAAMRILGAHRWREGLFDSFRSYRYIRAVMEVEDAAKRHLLGLKPSELDDFLPPEAARIHFADM